MSNTKKQLNNDFKSLPEEVVFYYSSSLSATVIEEIVADYKLEQEVFYDLIFEVINNKFDFSIIEKNNYYELLNISPQNHARFKADFIGKLFLPIDSYLENIKIVTQLSALKVNTSKYQKYVDDLYRAIKIENNKNLDELFTSYDSLDINSEAAAAKSIIASNLADLLRISDLQILKRFNGMIIFLINHVEGFQAEISDILLNNDFKITSNPILLDGKSVSPSIANWITSFIKFNGSDLFDSIALASFLSKDKNIQHLDHQEKDLIKKLLKLYRNLVFFPESITAVAPDDVEIFPVDKGADVDNDLQKNVDVLGNTDLGSKEEEPNLSRLPNSKEEELLKEMEELLENYESNSLEHKAIQQEIKSLRDKKSSV